MADGDQFITLLAALRLVAALHALEAIERVPLSWRHADWLLTENYTLGLLSGL
jgi:hypothetical protein